MPTLKTVGYAVPDAVTTSRNGPFADVVYASPP